MKQDTKGMDRRRERDYLCKMLRALHDAKHLCVSQISNISEAIRGIDERLKEIDEPKRRWAKGEAA